MGEYLSIFNSVKEKIYNQDIDGACNQLKGLLNRINIEYTTLTSGSEKDKRYKTITKLLPVLKSLKNGEVNEIVINTLSLDKKRLYGALDINPVINNKKIEDDGLKAKSTNDTPIDSIETQVVQIPETPIAKPKKINSPRNELIPLYLDDYIGQERAKRSLRVSIAAAKKENRLINHLLICSPYGIGKTTLANIIGNEMGIPFFSINASNLKDAKSVARYFSKIEESCIVFIDEIHTLKKDVQTILLSILTEFKVSFIDDNGEEEVYEIPPFTLIGATTQAGELVKPLINRFQKLELDDYTDDEKAIMVRSKFDKLGYQISEGCVADIAKRCRGVPRTIELFARGIRDVAVMENTKVINKQITDSYFDMNEIDENGLTRNDLLILRILNSAERPMALITLESKTGIQKEDLEYRYEPFLIKMGLIEKTEKGRIITKYGSDYIDPNNDGDSDKENSDVEEPTSTSDTPTGDSSEN